MEKKANDLADELANLFRSIDLSKKEASLTTSASSSSDATAAQQQQLSVQQLSFSNESDLVKQFRKTASVAAKLPPMPGLEE